MKIQVIKTSTEWKNKGTSKWQVLNVNFKTEDGKVEGRNLLSFTNKDAFNALNGAAAGAVFEIQEEKNAKGYPEIVAVRSLDPTDFVASATATTPAASVASGKYPSRDFETAEERVKRQKLIVRQSSFTSALANLSIGRKEPLPLAEVFTQATAIYDWVMENPDPIAAIAQMQDDLPE